MRIRVAFIWLLLCIFAEAKSIKIATYNVENLFDMQKSGLEYKEYLPYRHNWTKEILAKKLKNIAEVICDLNADVIALQEIENDYILGRLQKILKRVGCEYGYSAITSSKKTPIHNALLSKIALKKRRDVMIFRNGKHRSILEVDLKLEPKIKLFVNHWKSKAGPESERLVYAKALTRRIADLPKKSEYIIMGDFNEDYAEYRTIEPKHNDTAGKTAINHILKTIDNNRLIRLYNLKEGYHYNLWLELPVYARWSHNFFGDKEGIDAILVPASMNNGRGWEYQEGSFGVFKPDYLFAKRGRVNRWEYRHGKHTGKGYSDHLPVYASLVLGEESSRSNVKRGFFDNLISYLTPKNSKDRREDALPKTVPIKEMKMQNIASLIDKDKIVEPVTLRSVKVIWKHRDTAIIKQSKDGRAILLYRCAGELQEGSSYDITVYQKKRYKGLDELTDISVEKVLGRVETGSYMIDFSSEALEDKRYVNELVSDVVGVYSKRKIRIGEKFYPIYFKKGIKRPKVGEKIRILRAQIGYYKNHNELVVWSEKDYQKVE